MNSTEHWNAWIRDLTPEHQDAEEQPQRCPTCGGTGYVADVYGEAEACDECGYEDAVAEAIVAEPGMPF